MNAPAPITPAPAAAPAPASPVVTRVERRAQAAGIAKQIVSDNADAAPASAQAAAPQPAAVQPSPPEDRAASKLAAVSREHKRLMAEKEAHKAEVARATADLKAKENDLAIVEALRKGDFLALEKLDPQWYDKASKQIVAKMKPDDPAVLREKLNEETAKLRAELEELRNPKPKEPTPEEKAAAQARIDSGKKDLVTQALSIINEDPRLVHLQGESPEDVGEEVYKYMDHLYKQAGSPKEITDEQLGEWFQKTCLSLETALRVQKELTQSQEPVTTKSAATKSGSSGKANPQQITPRGSNTLTASMQSSVPVGGKPSTREERKAAANALMRAAERA